MSFKETLPTLDSKEDELAQLLQTNPFYIKRVRNICCNFDCAIKNGNENLEFPGSGAERDRENCNSYSARESRTGTGMGSHFFLDREREWEWILIFHKSGNGNGNGF